MANTYEPIATTTLTSASSSVVFSSIPQTYTDLVVVFVGKNTTANVAMTGEFDLNGDGGNNYSSTQLNYDNTSGRGTGNNGGYYGQLYRNSVSTALTRELWLQHLRSAQSQSLSMTQHFVWVSGQTKKFLFMSINVCFARTHVGSTPITLVKIHL